MAKYVAVLPFLVLAACAGAPTSSHPPTQVNLITAEELAEVSTLTAWAAIQQLRPFMLRGRVFTPRMAPVRREPYSRSAQDGVRPSLFVNGMLQDLSVLRSLSVTDVASIRFVSAADATNRYGTGLMNVLIEVTVR
jgi:hypothetical protein